MPGAQQRFELAQTRAVELLTLDPVERGLGESQGVSRAINRPQHRLHRVADLQPYAQLQEKHDGQRREPDPGRRPAGHERRHGKAQRQNAPGPSRQSLRRRTPGEELVRAQCVHHVRLERCQVLSKVEPVVKLPGRLLARSDLVEWGRFEQPAGQCLPAGFRPRPAQELIQRARPEQVQMHRVGVFLVLPSAARQAAPGEPVLEAGQPLLVVRRRASRPPQPLPATVVRGHEPNEQGG